MPSAPTPDVCSLPPESLQERLAWIRAEILPHVRRTRELPNGLVFEVARRPNLEARLERLVELERECCSGLDWTLESGSDPLQLSVEEEREVDRLMVEFQHYIADHIADRRAHPGDDVISHLVSTPVDLPDGSRMLTDGEIINIVDHLYIGGNETTTFALTSGMWLAIQHPEILQTLRDDPGQARRWVVYDALRQGGYYPWDYQPLQQASERYMRNHMDLNVLEDRQRFPRGD